MAESTGFTIRVIEITVSIPAGRTLGISKVAEMLDSDTGAIGTVLREYKDSGVPWWRITDDEGIPVFGAEFSARALEQYLTEGTPIRPSSSELGFAVALDVATPEPQAVSNLEAALADPAADIPAEQVSNFDVTAQPVPAQPVSAQDAAAANPFDALLRGSDAGKGSDNEAAPHHQG
ncbi:MGMT family protein [Diaminobutyricimonas sp. LJ205]|uniref:MGMT family protein n=1 Tax=Diaminobutyricimonas sp. LJ205 TaxID=2683590 RepID=UPI0012F4B145|nr:MGMT family protein [Diaminobutyricimonas sp. LJ205]